MDLAIWTRKRLRKELSTLPKVDRSTTCVLGMTFCGRDPRLIQVAEAKGRSRGNGYRSERSSQTVLDQDRYPKERLIASN